jgi:hypothetical protein
VVDRSLDDLLAMAHRYHSEGNVWQAMDMYWMLTDTHSGTVQALDAQMSLLELAETYERDDARHMARAVYERLSVQPEKIRREIESNESYVLQAR